MMTNESTLMLHRALSGSTNQLELNSTDRKDLFLIRLYSDPIVLKKLSLGKKGNFPLYPRRKLILLFFLLVIKYHVTYGLSLVQRVDQVREQSNIMIRIYLFFRVGDLLLKLLIPSFYSPKSILQTRVPTIGSVLFLLLRNVTPP